VQTAEPPALALRDITKAFPGVRALSGVSLTVQPGEVHALVGENGAGKSTLVKVVAGIVAPDSGAVELAGKPVTHFTPHHAGTLGVALVAQEPEFFAELTALENLFVGHWRERALGVVSWGEMERAATAICAEMGVTVPLRQRIADLSLADRQMIQIGRALLLDARLLILDEPTAALGQAETETLFRIVRQLAAKGVAILYISHRLEEIFELADNVTVLRDGRLVATQPAAGLTREDLVRMMVGAEVAHGREALGPERVIDRSGAPLLSLRGLTSPGRFEGVDLDLHAGEILGIAGLAGCGRNALAHALGGTERVESGQVALDGKPLRLKGPRTALEAGIVLAPGDRPGRALVLPFTVRENIALSVMPSVGRGPFTSLPREAALAEEYVRRLDVRSSSIEQVTGTLSGGNQQKVSLARRLAVEPRVLVLEEPTQGVDVGARAEIHRGLRKLAEEGLAIVLVSSDADEVLALSDRIAVMHQGRVAGVLAGAEATKEAILQLAFGKTEAAREHRPAARARRLPLGRELGLGVFLLVAMAALAVVSPAFREPQNFRDMAVNASFQLIAGLGMTMVIVTAGIDISIGGILAICCIAAGQLACAGAPMYVVFGGTALVGALLGSINSGGIAGLKLPPIIMTLATLTIFRGLVVRLAGGKWITDLPPAFLALGQGSFLGVPVPVIVAVLTTAAVGLLLTRTSLGRAIYAIGNNPNGSANQGISVRRVQFLVYALAGLLMGISAMTYAPRFSSIQTNSGIGLEMVVITAVVVGGTNIVGGRGTVLGTILGVVLLAIVDNGLNLLRAPDYWELAFQGTLVLIAVTMDLLCSGSRRREEGQA
jgi:rhamnose transport system ATP-binding protein